MLLKELDHFCPVVREDVTLAPAPFVIEHPVVSTGVILTHPTGVKVTHLGEDGSFAEAADVDPGASSGDTSHVPTGRRIEGDRAAGGVFA